MNKNDQETLKVLRLETTCDYNFISCKTGNSLIKPFQIKFAAEKKTLFHMLTCFHPNIETYFFILQFSAKISYNSSLIVQFVKYLNTLYSCNVSKKKYWIFFFFEWDTKCTLPYTSKLTHMYITLCDRLMPAVDIKNLLLL